MSSELTCGWRGWAAEAPAEDDDGEDQHDSRRSSEKLRWWRWDLAGVVVGVETGWGLRRGGWQVAAGEVGRGWGRLG